MKFTRAETDAAIAEARKVINDTGYGHWVSDDMVAQVVNRALKAVEAVRTVAENKPPAKG